MRNSVKQILVFQSFQEKNVFAFLVLLPATLYMSLLQGFPVFSVTDNKGFYLITVALYCTGEHKIHFIPGMIGPFLGVTLVPQPEVRNIMIPIFHDMMDWEQRKNGNFKQVKPLLEHLQYSFSCSVYLQCPAGSKGFVSVDPFLIVKMLSCKYLKIVNLKHNLQNYYKTVHFTASCISPGHREEERCAHDMGVEEEKKIL